MSKLDKDMKTETNLIDNRPQYIRIGDLLQSRIQEKHYPIGSFMPTENELCAEFSISRYTVREALRRLIEAGLITRKQGSGSRVIAQEPYQSYVHSMRSLDQLFQYASDTRFIILSMQNSVPDRELYPEIVADNEDSSPSSWLIISGLRLERDEDISICFSTVLVNNAFSEIAAELQQNSIAIYRRIEEQFGVEVSKVIQEMTVVPMPADAAKALEKKPKTIAVRVSRQYLDADGTILLASINYHPSERFFYSMQLTRDVDRTNWT